MSIKIATLFVLLATAAAAFAGWRKSAAKPPSETKTMPTTSEWTGQYGGPLEAGHEVVVDAKGWRALAAKLGLMDMEPDFAKSVAVAVFAGEKTTGGFTTAFDEPSLRGDDLLVRCRLKRPTGFTTQALTQPWAIKVFPRPKGKVVVELVSE